MITREQASCFILLMERNVCRRTNVLESRKRQATRLEGYGEGDDGMGG